MGDILERLVTTCLVALGLQAVWVAVVVLIILTYKGIEVVNKSKLWILFKVISCIPLVFMGLLSVNFALGAFFREMPFWASLGQMLLDGPIIALVFFFAIPKHGWIVAIPFLALWVSLMGYLAIWSFSNNREVAEWLALSDGIICILAICSSFVAYVILWKAFKAEELLHTASQKDC